MWLKDLSRGGSQGGEKVLDLAQDILDRLHIPPHHHDYTHETDDQPHKATHHLLDQWTATLWRVTAYGHVVKGSKIGLTLWENRPKGTIHADDVIFPTRKMD